MDPVTTTEPAVAAEIEAYVRDRFPATTNGGLSRDVHLFDSGIVDSVGVAELLDHIEERYGLEIPDEILLSDDFTTITAIARTITTLS